MRETLRTLAPAGQASSATADGMAITEFKTIMANYKALGWHDFVFNDFVQQNVVELDPMFAVGLQHDPPLLLPHKLALKRLQRENQA